MQDNGAPPKWKKIRQLPTQEHTVSIQVQDDKALPNMKKVEAVKHGAQPT